LGQAVTDLDHRQRAAEFGKWVGQSPFTGADFDDRPVGVVDQLDHRGDGGSIH